MHILKKKVLHELEALEREEGMRSGELSEEKLDLIKDLAKTYVYLCKACKMMKDEYPEAEEEATRTTRAKII